MILSFQLSPFRMLIMVCGVYVSLVCLPSCGNTETTPGRQVNDTPVRKKDYIRDYIKTISGKNDTIAPEMSQRGEVLIAYSDCYSCHKEDERAKGPAFKDIARRYPVNEGYIELLAHRIILGGSGAWGYSEMTAHPDVSMADARLMVMYILSLKEDRFNP